ncbi:Ku protein [Terracidiphilus sp.]|jgi:non-homologous end joining protein Ku|uniref:Ku protein n=1 Tax=Terracidiphilus sp. TaxID=1964191 RepID=UPI003C1E76A4
MASHHTIELEKFVKTSEIDPAYYEKPYFVLPENAAQEEARYPYVICCSPSLPELFLV